MSCLPCLRQARAAAPSQRRKKILLSGFKNPAPAMAHLPLLPSPSLTQAAPRCLLSLPGPGEQLLISGSGPGDQEGCSQPSLQQRQAGSDPTQGVAGVSGPVRGQHSPLDPFIHSSISIPHFPGRPPSPSALLLHPRIFFSLFPAGSRASKKENAKPKGNDFKQ